MPLPDQVAQIPLQLGVTSFAQIDQMSVSSFLNTVTIRSAGGPKTCGRQYSSQTIWFNVVGTEIQKGWRRGVRAHRRFQWRKPERYFILLAARRALGVIA